jgi:hypothetical protein
MLIECASCPVRGTGCADCFVPSLLSETGGEPIITAWPAADADRLDARERQALAVLAAAGMLPLAGSSVERAS